MLTRWLADDPLYSLCGKSSLGYIPFRRSNMTFHRFILPLPMTTCNQLSANWLQITLVRCDLYCMCTYLLSTPLSVAIVGAAGEPRRVCWTFEIGGSIAPVLLLELEAETSPYLQCDSMHWHIILSRQCDLSGTTSLSHSRLSVFCCTRIVSLLSEETLIHLVFPSERELREPIVH